MHINRLRLLGFKSFVEPTELMVEKGLTGVVGPNGCGKSNLLEALRWVMGETSHKSMRAAAMDDVIFSGTATRPARNTAEVTIFIDNSAGKAPAEFNGQRHAGGDAPHRARGGLGLSHQRPRGARPRRAHPVRGCGHRRPLAGAGAPGPDRRAGQRQARAAPAHPGGRRRHRRPAQPPPRGRAAAASAAEGNLARLNDILGQLNSQIESLKRQARQARRYKEVSAEIRKLDAIVLHLRWAEAQAQVDAEEADLAAALEKVGRATEAEAKAISAEADAADQLQPLRDQEAAKGAILARFKIEQDNLEREAQRTADRQKELEARVEQLEPRHGARAVADRRGQGDAGAPRGRDSLARQHGPPGRPTSSRRRLPRYDAGRDRAQGRRGAPERAHHLPRPRPARAGRAWRRRGASARSSVAKLERQLVALDAQTREIVGRAPDASSSRPPSERGQQLMAEIASIEGETLAAEEAVQAAAADAKAKSEAAAEAGLAAGQLKTEVETLAKLLTPAGDSGLPPILDQIKVEAGYEMALAAALGDDLDAPVAAGGARVIGA